MPSLSVDATLVLGFLVCIVLLTRTIQNKRSNHPPGPGGLPLLGSVHNLPPEHQEKKFFEWGKAYGDVIYFRLFQTPTIVLNSVEAANTLLTKRSAKYSDRPRMVLLGELMGMGSTLVPMPYGERFRKHRRSMHEAIGTREQLDAHRHVQRREVRSLLNRLLESPDRFLEHLHLYVGATMLEITYGKRIASLEDELVDVADRAISGINEAGTPGAMIVDFFPMLKSLPNWVPFKRRALAVSNYVQAWKNTGYYKVKTALDIGNAKPCVTATLLEEIGRSPTSEEEDDIQGLGCSVYGGKSLTRDVLALLMLALVRNPEVLHKAQAEVDAVVGRDRLPDFGDRGLMPYSHALLEELYRWNPPLPLAVPHRVMEDDVYLNYSIPQGCMVIPNIWAMSRNSEFYPDPEEFLPDRHLCTDLHTRNEDVPPPSTFAFGFGRRVCPGKALADASLWLAITSIVAAFDIRPPLDADGKEMIPPAAFQTGFTSRPKPFNCRIVPRSEQIARMISQRGR
ncbi:cytochrome P450 [Trametes meyenii]|nr:cytochrome P450 [Trametes meyenii]